jgi:hypothetical protein
MVGGKLKVGLDFVPIVDLSQDILDRANPDLMIKRQQDFIRENYITPKREFDLINKKKLGDKYPATQKEN